LAAEEGEGARSLGARAFLDFFGSDGITHFRDEEEQVFPFIVEIDDAQLTLQRVLIEHVKIHAAVRDLRSETDASGPSSTSMARVATLLESHIRFEEKVVFPLVELLMGEEELRLLSFGPRDRNGSSKIAIELDA
jgi:hemerythrin superfamily protein